MWGACTDNTLWGVNELGYEDFDFTMEYWQSSSPATKATKSFTLRIENKCKGMNISPDPINVYAYVGSTLTKDFYDSSSLIGSPRSSSDCKFSSSISVQNPSGVYVNESDSYFQKIINRYTPASGNINKTNIVFVPLIQDFSDITGDKTVGIKVSYSTLTTAGGKVSPVVEKMFDITVKPIKSIIKLCNTQISSKVTVKSPIADQTYALGAAPITITPADTHFSNTACTDSYNPLITNIPIQPLLKTLEYQDQTNIWVNFPLSEGAATFFSDKNDTFCVKQIDPNTLAFTLECSDKTKFATADGTGTKTFNLRYAVKYKPKDGEPASPNYVYDEFKVTLTNACKSNTITLSPPPAITTYSGGTLHQAAITVTHDPAAITAACISYQTVLVEVSLSSTTDFVSSGTVYSDLISSVNTDLAFTLSPKASTFDSGTADCTRYVRVSVGYFQATAGAKTATYIVTIKPNVALVPIDANCQGDVIVKKTQTSTKTAYADVTMNIPAIQYDHNTGISDTDCPVTVTQAVSIDNGTTWVTSGTHYTNLISSATSGALVLKPAISVFGTGQDTDFIRRDIKVTYTNSIVDQSIEDTFTVNIYSTAAIAKLANDQLDTMRLNPHENVVYTVGDDDLEVSSSTLVTSLPTDPLGFNVFETSNQPTITYALEFSLAPPTWTAITSANYLTTGIVGSSSTPCIKSGTLVALTFGFTMSCTDITKFGTDSTGQNVYQMRYTAKYDLCTTAPRVIEDPFLVTIKNPCVDGTLSVAGSARTGNKRAYVSATTAQTVASIEASISKSPYSCTNLSYLVEIYDDETLNNWTSLPSNSLYAALLTDGTTVQTNTDPVVKIKASSTHASFSAIKTVDVRVTYTLLYSQKTDGSNQIVDQFAVTVDPITYFDAACEAAVLTSSTTIANFELVVKHAIGTAATDKTFTAAVQNPPAICTPTYSYVLWYISPTSGATTNNPWSTYFTQNSGTLSYTAPPASALNGNAYLDIDFKIIVALDQYPSKTQENTFKIKLKNPCISNTFGGGATTQAAIHYEDGSNTAIAVAAFTYISSTTINADCINHEIFWKDAKNDVWSGTKPGYVDGTPDAILLSFFIKTTSVIIATAGDLTASRWVKRRHFNSYTGEEIVQELQIFFYKSLFCRAKTAALVSPSTLNFFDAVVGTSKTIESQLNTQSAKLVTTANTASACNYSATCQILDTSTQKWLGLSDWTKGGITCDTTGQWTVNIPTSNTNYNPSTTLTMRVVYEITDSQVPLQQTPSRQVTSELYLTVLSKCNYTTMLASSLSFTKITYVIMQESVLQEFPPFQDQIAIQDKIPGLCGKRKINVSPENNFLTLQSPQNEYTDQWLVTVSTNLLALAGTYNITVAASFEDYPSLPVASVSFDVVLVSPCTLTNLQLKQISDMTTTVGDPAVIQTFTQSTDTISIQLNKPDLCGERTYTIIGQKSFIKIVKPTNPWSENFLINLMAQSASFIGKHQFQLQVALDQYPSVQPAKAAFYVIILKPNSPPRFKDPLADSIAIEKTWEPLSWSFNLPAAIDDDAGDLVEVTGDFGAAFFVKLVDQKKLVVEDISASHITASFFVLKFTLSDSKSKSFFSTMLFVYDAPPKEEAQEKDEAPKPQEPECEIEISSPEIQQELTYESGKSPIMVSWNRFELLGPKECTNDKFIEVQLKSGWQDQRFTNEKDWLQYTANTIGTERETSYFTISSKQIFDQEIQAFITVSAKFENKTSSFTINVTIKPSKSPLLKTFVKAKPPTFIIEQVSETGLVTLAFDSPLILLNRSSDHLMINPTRYLEFTIVKNPLSTYIEDPEYIKSGQVTSVKITEFRPRQIQVQLELSNPLYISLDILNRDQLRVRIVDESSFISAIDFMTTADRYSSAQIEVQRFLSDEIKSTVNVIKQQQKTINAFVTGSLPLNIFLGLSLKYLWGMVNSLQFIIFMNQWKVNWPPNASLTIKTLRTIALGEFIDTNKIKAQAYDFYGLNQTQPQTPARHLEVTNSVQGIRKERIAVTCIVLVILVSILGVAVYYTLKSKYREKLIKILKDFYRSIFWNGLIRFYLQSFLKQTNTIMITFFAIELAKSYKKQSWKKLIPAIITSAAIFVIVPIIIVFALIKHRQSLWLSSSKQKFGSLYLGIRTNSFFRIFYVIEFLAVRFLFVVITFALARFPGILVNVYMLLNNFNIIYIGWYTPFDTKAQNNLELANSWMLHLVAYTLLLLVNLMPNPQNEINVGWGLISCIGLIFFINFGYIMSLNVKQLCRSLILWKHKRNVLRKKRDIEELRILNKIEVVSKPILIEESPELPLVAQLRESDQQLTLIPLKPRLPKRGFVKRQNFSKIKIKVDQSLERISELNESVVEESDSHRVERNGSELAPQGSNLQNQNQAPQKQQRNSFEFAKPMKKTDTDLQRLKERRQLIQETEKQTYLSPEIQDDDGNQLILNRKPVQTVQRFPNRPTMENLLLKRPIELNLPFKPVVIPKLNAQGFDEALARLDQELKRM